MVDDEIEVMYDRIIEYLSSKIEYFRDPGLIPMEYNDFNEEFDLANVVYTIQRQIHSRPTLSESNLIKAYRDVRAAEAEYEIRLLGRAAYNTDAALEEVDNRAKWNFNKTIINLHINGKDAGA